MTVPVLFQHLLLNDVLLDGDEDEAPEPEDDAEPAARHGRLN
jgi:hypothetical protein